MSRPVEVEKCRRVNATGGRPLTSAAFYRLMRATKTLILNGWAERDLRNQVDVNLHLEAV